jgi:hypothetical protein
LSGAKPPLLDRVHHVDARSDQLHQVLVGRHDGAGRALLDGDAGVGGDQVVGLVARQLAARQAEGVRGLADQRELRDQIFRRLRPMRLVLAEDVVAKGRAAGIEDHRDMVDLGIVDEHHQHLAETEDGVDRRAVRPVHRWKGVEGPEDVAGAVDQHEVADRLAVVRRRSSGWSL